MFLQRDDNTNEIVANIFSSYESAGSPPLF